MSRIVVANKYKCSRSGGKYTTEQKKLERKGLKVEESYVEEMNEKTEEHGTFFEIDEEATEQRLKDLEAKGKQIAPSSTAGRQAVIDEEEKEALQKEYFELTQKEAKKNWGIVRLTEEIAKEKGE